MSLRNSGEARIYTCICHPSKYSTTLQKLTVISTDINCSFLKSFCIFLLQDSPVILFQGGMFIAWKNFNDTIGHIYEMEIVIGVGPSVIFLYSEQKNNCTTTLLNLFILFLIIAFLSNFYFSNILSNICTLEQMTLINR